MIIHDLATRGDLAAVQRQLARGVRVDLRDERGFTPLACAAGSPSADEQMLTLLIDAGANLDALANDHKGFPLSLAACSGSLGKVQVLLNAGANVNLACHSGYTALIHVIYALHADARLAPIIELLAKSGADLDQTTTHGEFPLGVASYGGRFDAVACLLAAGADPSRLRWSPLMRAIAVGSIADMENELAADDGLAILDYSGEPPLQLAAKVGDVEKVELLCSKGADVNEVGRLGTTALILAATHGKADVVRFLADRGAEINAVDTFGATALMAAAQSGSADSVKWLLQGGADATLQTPHEESAIKRATNEAVARLLIDAGEDINETSTELKRKILGLGDEHVWTIDRSQYARGCSPRFGKSNPEEMKIPFWHEMIQAGVSAYEAKIQFGETDTMSGPVWCFRRFGMSFTELPDGRIVQIGGEHEDFYDPDFCIYNDVVVHDRLGNFTIRGYPEGVFPPTDFHSATYVDGCIYVIGGLRYHGQRAFGETLVYRLDCKNWQMKKLRSTGETPGWIFRHKATLVESNALVISGGEICKLVDGEEQHPENEDRFRLELGKMAWTRLV